MIRIHPFIKIAGLATLLLILGVSIHPVKAAPTSQVPTAQKALINPDDSACLACHQNPNFNITIGIQQKETLSLFVDPSKFQHSVHGEIGISCIGCHEGFKPEAGHGMVYGSHRELTLRMNTICANCHQKQSDQEKDSVHAAARAAGKLEAAICTDCHTAHEVQRLKDPKTGQLFPTTRIWIPLTCQKCHSTIYEKYRNSVHGIALTDGNNPDVPTCIDCHGVHIIEDPTTAKFRLDSPMLCAKCHTNPAIMDKYGISTQVLNTYVADFHGTTVTIFEKLSPDSVTNKPVCYDCHGVHDITNVNDPQKGLTIKQNLLKKCQRCHPNANTNFPDAWLSHYIPSPQKYPIVYYINLFYTFFIPGILLPMAVLVLMDFGRAMVNKFTKPHSKKKIFYHTSDGEDHHE